MYTTQNPRELVEDREPVNRNSLPQTFIIKSVDLRDLQASK